LNIWRLLNFWPIPYSRELSCKQVSQFSSLSMHRLDGQAQLWQQTKRFQLAETKPTKACMPLWDRTDAYFLFVAGTDHQRIAKLDRENEVAPPPKITPSVGRVRSYVHPAHPFLQSLNDRPFRLPVQNSNCHRRR
jgi:hypothetical protein